ncbi:hypothetical protein AAC387_Pa07g1756 [Persea americana]
MVLQSCSRCLVVQTGTAIVTGEDNNHCFGVANCRDELELKEERRLCSMISEIGSFPLLLELEVGQDTKRRLGLSHCESVKGKQSDVTNQLFAHFAET